MLPGSGLGARRPPTPPRQGDLAWEVLGRGSTELAERLRFAGVLKQTPTLLWRRQTSAEKHDEGEVRGAWGEILGENPEE